ncbi:hypothetical protein B5U98_27445 [Bosea sp. Tri-39]|uniref:hypothetical protein n=2 Tax=Bosea TaxID=85413 RepID=UPI000F765D58|nr:MULTISPECIES: hypothetical protein [unclassified Bosea (in: a-proteobacteria)]AZO82014.1 hypothetical protein BLM15_29920 [Bosea sp. Tri-49]RXT16665.1 hypothetical protein B5U98_27445 [Bosea sp. Tri-39]RXT42414.1 hypothetical protein B5U99_00475 [Bosea sp. Tri-54]
MDVFTMVIVACVAGEPTCLSTHISEMSFVSNEACEARIDDIVGAMTKDFAKRLELKGRQVSYDVSCMNRVQLAQKFGITQSDT